MGCGRGGRNWQRLAGEVVLPDGIEEIADEAFENSAMAILYGPEDSKVKQYALRNGIPFIAVESLE